MMKTKAKKREILSHFRQEFVSCALLLFLTTMILIHTVLVAPHAPCPPALRSILILQYGIGANGILLLSTYILLFSSHVYYLGVNLLESQRIHTTFIMQKKQELSLAFLLSSLRGI